VLVDFMPSWETSNATHCIQTHHKLQCAFRDEQPSRDTPYFNTKHHLTHYVWNLGQMKSIGGSPPILPSLHLATTI